MNRTFSSSHFSTWNLCGHIFIKNSFKNSLDEWFSNFFTKRTPKLTHIRPWTPIWETHDQNSHTFCHCVTCRWNYSENKLFLFLLGTPWNPLKDPWGSLDPSLRATALDGTAYRIMSLYGFWDAVLRDVIFQKVHSFFQWN